VTDALRELVEYIQTLDGVAVLDPAVLLDDHGDDHV
jgi:hypothetical protein